MYAYKLVNSSVARLYNPGPLNLDSSDREIREILRNIELCDPPTLP